ncbi:MAG: hypothetical protein AVDCRST_MAG89-5176, partial [uncultured Gemmatimonadetes bacterium]
RRLRVRVIGRMRAIVRGLARRRACKRLGKALIVPRTGRAYVLVACVA